MLKYKVEKSPSSGNRGDLRRRWLTGADGVVGAGDGGDGASGTVGAGWARGGRRAEGPVIACARLRNRAA